MSRIVEQHFKVSMVPGGVPTRVYLKRYDTGIGALKFHLYGENNEPYLIENDTTVSFKGSMIVPGGASYMLMYNCTFASNVVSLSVPLQLTVEPGEANCEIRLVDTSGNSKGSASIVLEIEDAAPEYGISISGSDVAYANQVLEQLQSEYAYKVLINQSPFKFKGSVAAQTNLPASGNVVNDTYYVRGLGYTMTWDGSEWSQSSFDIGNAFNLNQSYRTTIANYTDLNTITTPGNYKVTSAANAGTMTNGPVSNRAYMLSVFSLYQANRTCQLAILVSEKSPLYIRIGQGETWYDWSRLGDQRDIDAMIKKPTASPNGAYGQILKTNGNGNTEWIDIPGLKAEDISNNLTTTSAGKVLDASQGKILKDLIDELTARVDAITPPS